MLRSNSVQIPRCGWTLHDKLIDRCFFSGNPGVSPRRLRFIRQFSPGYMRSDATNNPSTNVYVSAYMGNGHFVIVAINMGPDDVSQQFVIQGASVTSMTPFRTSPTEAITQLSAASVTSGSFTYTLPGQSITTFVQ